MKSRKLGLARMTLRNLSDERLAHAAGGFTAGLDCFTPVASYRRSGCIRTCDTVYPCTAACPTNVKTCRI